VGAKPKLYLEMSGTASQQSNGAARAQRATLSATAPPPRRSTPAPCSSQLERALELAALIESSNDAVMGVTPEGLIECWNMGAEELFGYTREEAVGQHVLMLSPADRVDEFQEMLGSVLGGDRIDFETERIAKDGRHLSVRVTAAPLWDTDGAPAGAAAVIRDLSEQRKLEEALRASEQLYRPVVEALSEGVVMQDRDGRVIAFNKSAERLLGLRADQIAGSSSQQPPVELIHEDGSPYLSHEHPTMVCLRTGEPQTAQVAGFVYPDGSIRWMSGNAAPLYRPGESEPYAVLCAFADITSHRLTLEELHAARLEDLKRLALVAEYRDDDTNRHTERVARTAALLAAELGLDGELIETIRRASPLHDLGKIGIPDRILLKPGKLTREEFEAMQAHTRIGGRILGESDFPILRMATEIALTHHERWDGTGYPTGLRGEEIPITGRIVAVADAFDAMTHVRPYKGALPIDRAVAEIRRCSGTQFDPRVVDAFMNLAHCQLVERR